MEADEASFTASNMSFTDLRFVDPVGADEFKNKLKELEKEGLHPKQTTI